MACIPRVGRPLYLALQDLADMFWHANGHAGVLVVSA